MHGLGDPVKLTDMCHKIASDAGVKAIYAPADLKKPAEIRSMVKHTADSFGSKLDIVGTCLDSLADACSTFELSMEYQLPLAVILNLHPSSFRSE
jgi:NAD(P)-dependent dehydrogenase (short-subunit alcohol dehydrogenase family)